MCIGKGGVTPPPPDPERKRPKKGKTMKAIHFIDAATKVYIAKLTREQLFEMRHDILAEGICSLADQMAGAYERICGPNDAEDDFALMLDNADATGELI